MAEKIDISSERFLLNRTHDVLSSKWKLYIIYAIGEKSLRFGELRRTFTYISRLTLTRYLQELERDDLIERLEYPAPPLKTEYSLTECGAALYPIICQLIDWGEY